MYMYMYYEYCCQYWYYLYNYNIARFNNLTVDSLSHCRNCIHVIKVLMIHAGRVNYILTALVNNERDIDNVLSHSY